MLNGKTDHENTFDSFAATTPRPRTFSATRKKVYTTLDVSSTKSLASTTTKAISTKTDTSSITSLDRLISQI